MSVQKHTESKLILFAPITVGNNLVPGSTFSLSCKSNIKGHIWTLLISSSSWRVSLTSANLKCEYTYKSHNIFWPYSKCVLPLSIDKLSMQHILPVPSQNWRVKYCLLWLYWQDSWRYDSKHGRESRGMTGIKPMAIAEDSAQAYVAPNGRPSVSIYNSQPACFAYCNLFFCLPRHWNDLWRHFHSQCSTMLC